MAGDKQISGDEGRNTGSVRSFFQRGSGVRHLILIAAVFLLVSLCVFSTSYAGDLTLAVGSLPLGSGGRSILLVTDLSGIGPAVEISVYDNLGRAVATLHKLLPPNGKSEIDVGRYLPNIAGTVIVNSSTAQIAGEYWQIQENGQIFVLPLQMPVEERRYFLNCSRRASCDSNLLLLSDPLGSGPAVQMEFYNRKGDLIKVIPKILRPHGVLVLEVNDYVPWDILGKVSIRSFRGSVIPSYYQLRGSRLAFAALARTPFRRLLIDCFAADKHNSSRLVLTDASAEGPEVEIRFVTDNGVSKFDKLLPVNGTLLIDPADYVAGAASGVIEINSTAEIVADYWERDSQVVMGEPAVDSLGSLQYITHFSLFRDIQNQINLTNVGEGSLEAEIQFFRADGSKLGVRRVRLNPYQRVSELLNSFFGDEDLGTVLVRGTGENLVVTSHLRDPKSGRLLGKIHAQLVK